jgi:radical SAM superfamily enzyme YgiQ (UPF0313 family)
VAALVGPEIEENLSLRYLASSLAAAGFRSEIVPFSGELELESALAAIVEAPTPPLLVGLSLAFQWKATDTLALALALRERGYRGHITAGGHFATFACGDLLRDFVELDSIVRQEGEHTLVALLEAITKGAPLHDIPGLGFRVGEEVVLTALPSNPELATLPPPDRRGTPAACFDHRIAPLVSSRGCYANCTFCCIAAWHEQTLPGKRYRVREPDAVAQEMVELARTRDIEIFVFHDDNFFVPGKRVIETSDLLCRATSKPGGRRGADGELSQRAARLPRIFGGGFTPEREVLAGTTQGCAMRVEPAHARARFGVLPLVVTPRPCGAGRCSSSKVARGPRSVMVRRWVRQAWSGSARCSWLR